MSIYAYLKEYQAIEAELIALDKSAKNTPSYDKLTKLHRYLKEQTAMKKKLESEVTEKKALLNTLEEKYRKLSSRLELEESEYASMRDDEHCMAEELIATREAFDEISKEITKLRRDMYDAIQTLEQAGIKLEETLKNGSKAKREYDKLAEVCEAEQSTVNPQLEEAKKRVEEMQKQLPADVLKKYKEKQKNFLNPVAEVKNNKCSGCNMDLPMVTIKKIDSGDTLVECDNCGRILVI